MKKKAKSIIFKRFESGCDPEKRYTKIVLHLFNVQTRFIDDHQCPIIKTQQPDTHTSSMQMIIYHFFSVFRAALYQQESRKHWPTASNQLPYSHHCLESNFSRYISNQTISQMLYSRRVRHRVEPREVIDAAPGELAHTGQGGNVDVMRVKSEKIDSHLKKKKRKMIINKKKISQNLRFFIHENVGVFFCLKSP